MANTYTQIYIRLVIVVNNRQRIINNEIKIDLYKYISGIIENKGQKLYIVNGVEDHLHLLLSIKPNCNLSELVRDVKSSSSKWLNEDKKKLKFEWQKGFGAFSISQSSLSKTINYIKNQELHHKIKTFQEEYLLLLENYNISYDSNYLFDDIEK